MESRVKLLGHPAHQLLVPIPLGGLVFSVGMDGVYTITGKSEYASAAKHALTFGLGAGLLAAPFGVVDYLAIQPGTRAKRVGLQHAASNLLTLGLFAASRLLRSKDETSVAARWLSGSAFVLSGVAAWFGGELVNRLGVGGAMRPIWMPQALFQHHPRRMHSLGHPMLFHQSRRLLGETR